MFCSLALFSFSATAAWYEVTGKSAVVATSDQAKLHALQDAIYRAVQFAGADVGSLANLSPLLNSTNDEFQFTNHEVRYVLVEGREEQNGIMYVRARIDIYPSATSCHTAQYKKTMLISNMMIESPQQAVMGQIYELGADFSKVLNKQLNLDSNNFLSLGTTDYALDKNEPSRVRMIAQDSDAQYLVSGKITDMTATISGDESTINRQFALDLTVFDGKTGNDIFHKNYREVARWPFPKTSIIDTQSARFWASSYGDMLLRVSRDIMLDFESAFACKITLPEVVARHGNNVTIDLGRKHGVKVGDKLTLWHTGSFIDQRGMTRSKVTQSDITLTVTSVYEDDADLQIDQPTLAGSVNVGDVMHKQLD